MKDFNTFDFHPKVAAGVRAAGYTTPTPIQIQAMPTVLEGRDVMGLAQTGTGKTAAFALPILNRLIQGKRGTLRALIVAPTRELAEQIHDAFGVLGRQTGLRSATAYGGVSINPQINRFKRGVDILVACPGRLLDHLNEKRSACRGWKSSFWTKPTRCSTWAFSRTFAVLSRKRPASVRRSCFRPPCPVKLRIWPMKRSPSP